MNPNAAITGSSLDRRESVENLRLKMMPTNADATLHKPEMCTKCACAFVYVGLPSYFISVCEIIKQPKRLNRKIIKKISRLACAARFYWQFSQKFIFTKYFAIVIAMHICMPLGECQAMSQRRQHQHTHTCVHTALTDNIDCPQP